MNDPERSPPEGADPPAASLRAVQVLLGVALVAVAFAVPARPSPSVEASFGGGDNPCVAQIVGLVQAQVLWFDGTPFFDREDFTDDTHLYVTEAGAPDPTRHVGPEAVLSGSTDHVIESASSEMPVLVRSGQYYNFTDANGVTWNVTEAYMDVGVDPWTENDPGGTEDPENREGNSTGTSQATTKRYYTWIVEIGDSRDDNNIGVPGDIGDGGEYNFATRVNTTKFTNETRREHAQTVTHTNSTSTNGTNVCHPDHEHVHKQYEADLWLGRQPDLLRLDCEPLHSLTASYFAGFEDDKSLRGNLTGSYRGGTCAAGQITDFLEGAT